MDKNYCFYHWTIKYTASFAFASLSSKKKGGEKLPALLPLPFIKGPCFLQAPRRPSSFQASPWSPCNAAAVSLSHVHKPDMSPWTWADFASSFPSVGHTCFGVLIVPTVLHRLLSGLPRIHQACRALRDLRYRETVTFLLYLLLRKMH